MGEVNGLKNNLAHAHPHIIGSDYQKEVMIRSQK